MHNKPDFGVLRRLANTDPTMGSAFHYHVVRVSMDGVFVDLALTDSDVKRLVTRCTKAAAEETLVTSPSWKDRLCAWIMA